MSYQDFLNPSQREYKSEWSNELSTLPYTPLDEEAALDDQRKLAREIEREEERKDRKAARAAALRRWSCSCLHRGTRGQRAAFGAAIAGFVIFFVVFFTVPRSPTFSLANDVYLNSTETSGNYSTTPASLYFTADLWLTADTGATYIPIQVHDFDVKVHDLSTDMQVGSSASSQSLSLGAKRISSVKVPLVFDYTGGNSSDTAYGDITRACVSGATDTLSLSFTVTSYVRAVMGKQYRILNTNSVACPVTLALVST